MFSGSWGGAVTGSGGGGTWGSGGDGGTWGSGGGGGTWGGVSAPSGGGGVASGSGIVSGVSLPGPGGGGSFGPWGEGVYTPLDYPATKFLSEHESLESGVWSLEQNSLIKILAVGALLLWALKK